MQRKRREFVGVPRDALIVGSLRRRIESAKLALERLEREGGSKRAQDRWRRQIKRMRELRASILAGDGEALCK